MRRCFGTITLDALMTGSLIHAAAPVRAAVTLDGIHVTDHGGALLQHVRVAPLFYGSSWKGSRAPAYLKGFLGTLFKDGRFMANLSQYGTAQSPISDGSALDPVVDMTELPKADGAKPGDTIQYQVTDAQIQSEIRAQIARGSLPAPDQDTLYLVCTPSDVVVQSDAGNSVDDFSGYHDFDLAGSAYAVVAMSDVPESLLGAAMTQTASHELAEAITDPQPSLMAFEEGGWYDDQFGEIGDIVVTLAGDGLIDGDDLNDVLTGPDGTEYVVQKVWSNQDQAPVAFAPAAVTRTVSGAGTPVSGTPATGQPAGGGAAGGSGAKTVVARAPATTRPGAGQMGRQEFRYGRLTLPASHYGQIVVPTVPGDPYGPALVTSRYQALPYRYGRLVAPGAPDQAGDNIGSSLAASQAAADGTVSPTPDASE